MNITIEDISKAVKKYKKYCKKHKISPDPILILHPGETIIPRRMYFDLGDGTEVNTTVYKYNLFENEYGYTPDKCKDIEEFKDKLMVAEL